ncbi:CBS domain-containing protein [Mycoplana rhizolycopersici]|jgi:CBS domain-containing protein|uniref:CBS domain-containing protein n=1 Tax=Mycoplana rhizolycopersici TaxID=2746702 RepID=A0ABX2QNY1_9HYPH|nr:CBS domain-containing protein [Rhizobium rhizolycopersici]NVP58019.1 CBS domain-containing protein [Rhizobium rhizolycopersici]
MRVKDVMSKVVVRLSPDNSVRQAARLMLDNHISGLPVVDDEGHVVGVITEGDLIRRTELCSGVAGTPADPAIPAETRASAYVKRSSWKVGDAMTADPVTIDEDASVSRVAMMMQDRGVKRIPVMRDGQLVGIVSRADLLEAILAAKQDEMQTGDDAIRRSILVRLGENTGLEGLGIDVTVVDGTVHLWGKVETVECRKAARVVAEGVHGVRGVVEHFPALLPG